ncbi:MAG: Eco57I restriction-modification methylase domain-containing protein, partial [Candidatus Hodarchaeota archaeon]
NKLKSKSSNPLKNLYGVDLNESATKITKINLWLRKRNKTSINYLDNNIKFGDSIVSNQKISSKAFNWKSHFDKVFLSGGFDFIIGNPPYVTLKKSEYDPNDETYSSVIIGSVNAASLVLTKSISLLKEGGVLAFVLPKTIMRVNSYSKLRNFLINKMKVIHILDLGKKFKGVRGEQIVLFLQKPKRNENPLNTNVLIKNFKTGEEFEISQKLFDEHNNFLIFEEKEIYNLIDKISKNSKQLLLLSEINRGVSISPKVKSISKTKKKGFVPILKGSDVQKFKSSYSYYINENFLLNNFKTKSTAISKKKIIVQNIFSSEAGIISTLDLNGDNTFDTVTNIIPNSEEDIYYLFGILNSKLANFYLTTAVYNLSTLTMHTDKSYIGQIPIKNLTRKEKNLISDISKKILNSRNPKMFLGVLDSLVYKLYGITKKDQDTINKTLRAIMSKKSYW